VPKIPRDISGRKLTKLLEKYGYKIIRESASHMRLIPKYKDKEHKITIPDHNPIKIGTLNNILNDIANYLKVDKKKIIEELFRS